MTFKPPEKNERLKAIGPINNLPMFLRKALNPNSDFEPVSVPKQGDWLAEHSETGQTFDDYVKSKPNQPDKYRSTIYLQPLGKFPNGALPIVDKLKEYTLAFFGMKVKVLPLLELSNDITSRINPYTRKRQILTSDVLNILKKHIPSDAFCMLAITMEDLYPQPSWNFVFGQALLRERVGIYSFARYDPAFYGEKRDKDYEKLLLKRSCKVLTHETSHMFGLQHCIYFKCVLNGSNHLQESDARPMHLCPVCLHKLQYNIGFDVIKHYSGLYQFYETNNFDEESLWVKKRLNRILGTEEAGKILDQ